VHKQEFVAKLAERCQFSKAEAGRVVDAILDSLTQVMADGEEVSFTGFGKFLSQRRRARESVNPRDPGQTIRIRAANVPKFRAGALLREAASHAPADLGAAASGSDELQAGNGAKAAARSSGRSEMQQPAQWRPLGERK
jgi:DNA-binding protein HU-beta